MLQTTAMDAGASVCRQVAVHSRLQCEDPPLNTPMMGSDKPRPQKRGEEAFPTILQALHVLHTQPEPSTVEIGHELDELGVCARTLCVFVRV